jgi:DNA invertase Pin-like site-specific DNA recombinase
MAVYAYCRVSTNLQDNGLETQHRAITGYSMMKGWDITHTYLETAVSGSIPLSDRPEGNKLISVLKAGDIVITAKLDRMFRSAADALVTLEELKAIGVELHMIDLGGDVCGNGISKLVFTILSAVAEQERDRIRERIRETKRYQASNGRYLGGRVPFGYQVSDGQLVADDEQQAILGQMKAMRADGLSYAKIGKAIGMDMKTVSRILARD